MKLLTQTVSYFFPSTCLLCRSLDLTATTPFCEKCLKALEEVKGPYCPSCGDTGVSRLVPSHHCQDCLREPLPFQACRSIFVLKKPFSKLLHHFKFRHSEVSLQFFSEKLREKIKEFNVPFDYIVPVPSHWWRLVRRGYNPSLLLAASISKAEKIDLDFKSLRRKRLGAAQKVLKRQERLRNIRNAFQLRKSHPFRKKNILLIDDVYTTGATLIACAKTLKQGGATVYGLTLARTPLEFGT